MNLINFRGDFPILSRKVNGKPLVYLDNAATSQKPKAVLDKITHYYTKHNANVHRGVHTLSQEATEEYELARKVVANFIGIKDTGEVIFVKNATEALNLIAYSWGRVNIGKGDEIVLTVAEHHSNFVVWQQLAAENGAILKVIPIDENGEIDLVAFKKAVTSKTKLVSFFHVSNVLGTISDVRLLTEIVKKKSKAVVVIDGAQAVPHMKVDIAKIGCDFYVFTGHKMLGPMGIGVLWGRRELLEKMPPFLFGGDMISKVTLGDTSWNELPWKFEAGTPDAAAAVGLMAAVEYLEKIGMDKVRAHETELTRYAISKLREIPEVEIYGSLDAAKRGGVIAFNVGPIHAHDVASILDSDGIAIRSGHHCAQPLMDFLGRESAARASFYIYNTKEEVDKLIEGIERVIKVFKLRSGDVIARNGVTKQSKKRDRFAPLAMTGR